VISSCLYFIGGFLYRWLSLAISVLDILILRILILGGSSDIYSFCSSGNATLSFMVAAFKVRKGYLSKSGVSFFILPQFVIT